jgi:predicted amidohydrolase
MVYWGGLLETSRRLKSKGSKAFILFGMSIVVATAQSLISTDIRENGFEIRRLMTLAARAGADLIHFPEAAISGYVKSQISEWKMVDWQVLRDELEATARLAGGLGLWVVLGCNHSLTEPNCPHNSLYIISNEGKLHTRYDKRYCSHTELNGWYTPGTLPCVFEIKGIRFGCAICIEVQFPEVFMEYLALDVYCVLLSAYSDDAMFAVQARGHAACTNTWISFSVPAQMSYETPSQMIAPNGSVLAVCETGTSTLLTTILDADAPEWEIPLKRARPWRALARQGDI